MSEAPKESTAAQLGKLVKVETDEKRDLAIRRTSYVQIVDELRGIEVDDDEDFAFASSVLQQLKGYYKEIDTKRKKITDPLNAALKEFRGWYKPALDVLEEGETILKKKLGDYAVRKEQERIAQMQAIAEASAKGDFDAAHAASRDLITTPEARGISVSARWEYEITDINDVPREFLALDHSAVKIYLREAGKDDPKPIPGLKFTLVGGVTARQVK